MISGNEIFGADTNTGIMISDATNTTIRSNQIHNYHNGIYTSDDAVIIRNSIYSNRDYGVVSFSPDPCFVLTNDIYDNDSYGLYISGNNESIIMSNNIYNNSNGIYVNAVNSYLIKNVIHENQSNGILMDNDTSYSNYIYTNHIYGPQYSGISIYNSDAIIMQGNHIFNNQSNGVFLTGSTNSEVKYNHFYKNLTAMNYNDNNASSVYLNYITNNVYGIETADSPIVRFDKNNIYNNSGWNYINRESVSDFQIMTNNWFGTTAVSNIASSISNISGRTNFIPYRLFTEFNIEPEADTVTMPRVTWGTAYHTNSCDVILKWKPTFGGDFVKYNIYRTTNDTLWSNFTYTDVATQVNPISMTNVMDIGLGEHTYYYYITVMDNPEDPIGSIYTNESWYSPGIRVQISLNTIISITKSISNIIVNNNNTQLIPGSTIIYKISYSNIGASAGRNVVIYDRISPFVTFSTMAMGTATGWTMEYSTNMIPIHNYISTDYTNNYTSRSNVKWIRWKKASIDAAEDGLSFVYKVILK